LHTDPFGFHSDSRIVVAENLPSESVTTVSEVLFYSYAYGSRCCFYDVFVLTLACMTCSWQE